MSIAKVIEISSQSQQGFEDAIKQGIASAAKTVRNIRSAWVNEQQVIVDEGKVIQYRVNLKVTFIVE